MIDENKNQVITRTPRGKSAMVSGVLFSCFTSLMLAGLFMFALSLNGGIEPKVKRGFFCSDTSINYPFRIDTIGVKTLLFIALVLPGVVIKTCHHIVQKSLARFVSERSNNSARDRKDSGLVEQPNENDVDLDKDESDVKRRLMINESDGEYEAVDTEESLDELEQGQITLFTRLPVENGHKQRLKAQQKLVRTIEAEFLKRSIGDFQIFFFGLTTNMLITGIGKVSGGRLRPHFMQRCKPDVDCSLPTNAYRYFENYTCTEEQITPKVLAYITTSWPSGHASVMFFSMLYLILYLNTVIPILVNLNKRARYQFHPLILYTTNVLMVGLASYISLTRISDYHHHPFDVFSGVLIGSVTAITLSECILKKDYDKIVHHFQ